jgi:hypothetical protein
MLPFLYHTPSHCPTIVSSSVLPPFRGRKQNQNLHTSQFTRATQHGQQRGEPHRIPSARDMVTVKAHHLTRPFRRSRHAQRTAAWSNGSRRPIISSRWVGEFRCVVFGLAHGKDHSNPDLIKCSNPHATRALLLLRVRA